MTRGRYKKAPVAGRLLHSEVSELFRGRIGRGRAGGLGRFQLGAGFRGALLQFFLQLLLVFLEHLRIGRRAVIGLGELAGQGSSRFTSKPP